MKDTTVRKSKFDAVLGKIANSLRSLNVMGSSYA
jgi:hypothetical protein